MNTKSLKTMIVPLIVVISASGLYAQNGHFPEPVFKYKSESTAVVYSVAGTVIPTAAGVFSPYSEARFWLLSSGILIGPSLSYFYADEPEKGFKSIGTRTGICAGAFILTIIFESPVVFYTGIGCAILHGVHDTRKALIDIKEHNRSLDRLSLNLSIRYFADYDAPGIGLNINF